MPGTFIFSIVLAAFAVVAMLIKRGLANYASRSSRQTDKVVIARRLSAVSKWSAVTWAVFAALMILVSSYDTVGTQNIGILTSFGRPVGHVGNGLVWHVPWEQVTDMDEAIQVTDFSGRNCRVVRIAKGQTACFDGSVRWRVTPAGSDSDFRNYKGSTSGVENGLINPELNRAMNNAFETFDPVTQITSPVAPGDPGNPTITQLTAQVQQQMQAALQGDVTIVSMFLKPNYDDAVQAKLNSISTQAGATVVAQEQIATNQALAKSYEQIAAILASNPDVLVSQCMTSALEPMAKANAVPVGFTCWPGGSAVTGVIANPKTK